MKRKLLITIVMMLFAVQGYAQRERREGRHGQRTEYTRQGIERRQVHRPQRYGSKTYDRRYRSPQQYYAPPRYHHHPAPHHHRPVPRYYHHHYCAFDNWYWYSWGGYHNRYICHRHYRNRYFDSMLGYYLWGALNAPTRLDIGNMTLTRYNNTLKIQIGNQISYLDLYRSQNVVYKVGYTTVNITTGSGYTSIHFYDEYGNEASYTL
ncbi:MAG: hypothetical protein NC218_09835 [Acetobacter sp.]|nr:hypothetical protein [Acetobacter sp.]